MKEENSKVIPTPTPAETCEVVCAVWDSDDKPFEFVVEVVFDWVSVHWLNF